MLVARRILGLTCALAFLAGCEVADQTLFPTLAGEETSGGGTTAAPAEGGEEVMVLANGETLVIEPLQPAGGSEALVSAAGFGNTGTVVAGRVREIASELENLQRAINQNRNAFSAQLATTETNAQSYYATIAAIMARLQIGTTPGNPVLVGQYDVAQAQFDRLTSDVAALHTLSAAVSSNAATSAYLADRITGTLLLSGAVEEDHRQLNELLDLNARAMVTVERTMGNITAVTERQTNYVNTERNRMAQLVLAISNGRLYGPALAELGTQQPPPALTGDNALASRRPLVVIRFDQANVAYEEPVYQAVSAALQHKPDAVFDIVAVAPAGGSTGDVAIASSQVKRSAEEVLRSLAGMGLPAERVTISSTTSFDAQVNEVRIFVR